MSSIGRTLAFSASTLMALVSAQTLLTQLRAQYGPKRESAELRTLRRIERLLHARLGAPPRRVSRARHRTPGAIEYGDIL